MVTNSIVDQLKEQLADLEREFRVEIPERIRLAREMGDLRESGEYETAKDRQGFLQARIGFLQQRIAELSSINLANVPKDRIAFGTTVYLTDLETGEERVYRLVASEQVDAGRGWISPGSPIGRALVGKREGDEVTVSTPGGKKQYEIARIVTLHDAIEEVPEAPKHE